MLLGAHQSVAGGLFRAYGLAQEDGCEAIQIFTKNSNQWRDPSLTPAQIEQFRTARGASTLASAPVLSHDSYLINLCSGDDALRQRSSEALLHEAQRCEALGIEYVVLHPGAHLGAGADAGVAAAAEQLIWVLRQSAGAKVMLLVENTAGQGTAIGSRFEEVGGIVHRVQQMAGSEGHRIGVCFDTCHAFAAGYDLSNETGFDRVWQEFDRLVGFSFLHAMHLNDSKKPLESRVDRHERINLGELGGYPFWRLVNDSRWDRIVGVLETPPEGDDRAFRDQLIMLKGLRGAKEPPARRLVLQVQEPAVKKTSRARTRK